MIRTLIVDDEPAARRGVRHFLADLDEFQVVDECGSGAEMIVAIEALRPDLVFLDVRMPDIDGFEALSRVPESMLPRVVFVTAYDRFAVRAFEAHAIDFLLKPISRDRFRDACDRAREALSATNGETEHLLQLLETLSERALSGSRASKAVGAHFTIRSRGRVIFVPHDELIWVAASGDYVRLHTELGSHLMRCTMREIEDQLDPSAFIRIHRSTLVRVDAIREIRLKGEGHRGEVILADGTIRALSRAGKKRLHREFDASI